MDSWPIDQELDTIFPLFVATRLNTNTKYPPSVRYNPMLVKDKDKLPSIGAFKLIKSLISN